VQVDVLVPLASVSLVTIPCAERRLHQHLRQALEGAPLLLGRIVIKRGRPRLIDQVAAFIAGNQETAGSRAVQRLRRPRVSRT
jgi:hypothetical protein